MFITLIVVMVVLAVLSFLLSDSFSIPVAFIGICSGVFSFIIAVFLGVATYSWYAAEYQAKIINREYNTQYTQEEIFYASNVIETIRDIQRTRNEITINVNTAKKEK